MNSKINLDIELDVNKIATKIEWSAPDGGVKKSEADAFILSVWDGETKDTLKIDLWTKNMMVDDMKRFYHQTLLSMADGFKRSTNEDEMSEDIRDFAKYFAEKLKLIE
jgi:gliding motility-associated protein GldC